MQVQRKSRFSKNEKLGLGFWISRFFGIVPFSTDGKFSTALWLRSVFVTIFLMVSIFPAEVYEYIIKWPKRKELVKRLVATMNALHKPVVILPVILHISNIYKIRGEFEKVLEYLIKFRYKKNNLIVIFMLLWSAIAEINFMYYRAELATWTDVSNFIRRRSMFLAHTVNMLIIMQYSGFLYYLEKCLRVARSATRINSSLAILEHAQILDLCKVIDSGFGSYLLVVILDTTYTIIYSSYFVTSLFFSSEHRTYSKISEKVFVAVALAYQIGYPTSKCESVKKAAEAFNNELFKIMRESRDLCSDKKLRLYITMKQTVDFTACGFFSLGYPLVTSIIAAATTYLVILVQFSMTGG